MEGIAAAKKRGVYTGRKKALTDAQVAQIRQRVAAGETKSGLAREYGVSRETLYKHLRAGR
jgi:DNA invertase Pin-like site-specific DNA recombinase